MIIPRAERRALTGGHALRDRDRHGEARGQDQLKGFDGPVPILLAAPSETNPAGDEEAGRDAEDDGPA